MPKKFILHPLPSQNISSRVYSHKVPVLIIMSEKFMKNKFNGF